ncbi:related to 37S ribosomal protein S25, mitochondrial [Saccharomycodes ludwigii]|uniref:37S ribosomal protein S25, mitochondrial n=1 Tax=Saccharomycodes ludwigii TaxID=36035 RepID=A0A376B9R5_9ASCO|nr:hypothetical protein SCDLUD_002760 [Saccharomycodes ludwigii]KAH3901271.1 hypothetical protein SCDLUD_002760 [Saccharomycodes ludwigii]SSD60860.1 related to 37S ribosomal protein S25, mitochondrial [Saccharomycodes ludwigii]
MKIQKDAVNILQRTSDYLASGIITKKPQWYDIVANIPPTKQFTRIPRLNDNPSTGKPAYQDNVTCLDKLNTITSKGYFKTRPNSIDKHKSTKHLYKPVKLKFFEDKLRTVFYDQHPWELSRPKVLIENLSVDISKYDWSSIQQLGKPLDGESVVQRTLYLLKNENKDLKEAYDIARFEFYKLRIEEELNNQIVLEEAIMMGSVFKESAIETGFRQEQDVIKAWEKKAIRKTQLLEAKSSNPSAAAFNDSNGKLGDKQQSDAIDEEELAL